MKARAPFSFYAHWSILLSWRIVTALVLCSVMLFPAPLSSAPSVWPAPVLLAPANMITTTVLNYPPAAVPVFEWEPVPGATQYRIQIDDDSCAFGTPIRYDQVTPNTKYIPTSNAAFADNTNWCWKVRVEQPTPAGDWSEYRQFTKNWSTTSNAPTLSAPADGATIEFFEEPIFSWSPVVGAADYILKIGSTANCSSLTAYPATLATSYNLSTRLANGNYYWCVVPRNAAGNNGLESEVRQFTVGYAQIPQLLEPANSSVPVYTPVFRWTAVKGAVKYRLQYSTDPSFASKTSVDTTQTTYTPPGSIPNDQTYYWRVAAVYGSNWEGPFSDVWNFTKHWYQQPRLLTPRPNELTNVPLFTWTPVREAKRYLFEASINDPGFAVIHWTVETANTFYYRDDWDGKEWNQTMFWRVTPYDNAGNKGQPSEVGSFRPRYDTAVPENIWPRYFYTPPFIASGFYASPYDIPISYDYTVDSPTFYWSRTLVPAADPRVEAAYYRLEVDDDPNFYPGQVEWTILTENCSATPTEGNPFTPTAATNYYWRVTPYSAAGTILTNSLDNQPWLTQIDLARQTPPAATSSPTLQFPQDGEKAFAVTPNFEWLPQQGAVRYEFELSADPAFSSTTYLTRTIYTRHTPVARLPIGTYFWRVRGLDSGNNTVGDWSAVWRVIISMQTRWFGVNAYTLGALPAQYDTVLATDAVDGLGATELTTLYMAQDSTNWFIGFHVTPTLGSTVWYGLYLDTNQKDGNGATFAPANRPALTTSSYFQPEYAIYVMYENTGFITTTAYLHSWITNTLSWDPLVKNLVNPQIGGALHYNPTAGYVELKVPKGTILDRGDKPFALSVALFSTTSGSALTASDTVPDNSASAGVLTEFKTIGDHVTLVVPTGGLPGERPTLPYSPYVYAESPKTDLVAGYKVEVARDPLFTSVFQTLETKCTGCEPYPDLFQYIYTTRSIYEDNTLYWRFSIRHKFDNVYYPAPPSEPHLLTKAGPTPGNLRTEGNYSTPRFIWDAVEGAGNYQFESATNPEFSQNLVSQDVNHESYTPPTAYVPGTYYWRVRAENSLTPAYLGKWSPISILVVTLPQTSLVEPPMGGAVHRTPTFRWNASLLPGNATTIGWTAVKYRLQVANNPNFTSPIENIVLDTITWTPTKSFPDGTYYWRVAVVDANSKEGPFSSVAMFTKQYPVPTLVSPLPGTGVDADFPTFVWQPVNGAASYRIEIAQNPQFSPLLDSATTNNVTFTPLKKYTATQYYWRVAMIDKSGSYGPWTDSVLIDPYPYDIFLPLALRNFKK
ncbi:MAG TPA: hypothetical protein PKZ84_16680 [Anaerolineae bacterium]|nr:hypothetical protein [Anaerolineae bacterium]HQI85237.1 hypothetical protein [Anaerolineae bacterium]